MQGRWLIRKGLHQDIGEIILDSDVTYRLVEGELQKRQYDIGLAIGISICGKRWSLRVGDINRIQPSGK